jgi:hypothetical protein
MSFFRCNLGGNIVTDYETIVTPKSTESNYSPNFSKGTEVVVTHHLGRTPTQVHVFENKATYNCGQSSAYFMGQIKETNGMQWAFHNSYSNSSSAANPWRGNRFISPNASDSYIQMQPPIYADKNCIMFGRTDDLSNSGVMTLQKGMSLVFFAYACPDIEEVVCQGITLSENSLTFSDTTTQTVDATPQVALDKNVVRCTDLCYATSSDTSVAKVYWYLTSNAVWKIGVIPVASGTCTVTVHMGDASATISVTVDIHVSE